MIVLRRLCQRVSPLSRPLQCPADPLISPTWRHSRTLHMNTPRSHVSHSVTLPIQLFITHSFLCPPPSLAATILSLLAALAAYLLLFPCPDSLNSHTKMEFIDQKIAEGKVVMFSKSYCKPTHTAWVRLRPPPVAVATPRRLFSPYRSEMNPFSFFLNLLSRFLFKARTARRPRISLPASTSPLLSSSWIRWVRFERV